MKGKLTVITGCMYAGKTTRLIHMAEIAKSEGKKIEVFYPEIDTRYKKEHITSHDDLSHVSKPLPLDVEAISNENWDIVFIDEAQFFENGIVSAVIKLLNEGIDVVVGGLDRDYRAQPFGSMPELSEMAHEIIYLKAKCNVCGNDATFTFRLNAKADEETIVIGGQDIYEARCEEHYIKPE